MALYSLEHSTVGRSTHRAGTAGAHVGYVVRASACSAVLAENMPVPRIGSKGGEARTWLDAQEEADRKNARVADKLRLALPIELNPAQRAELVRDFARRLGGGRVAWLAAIHDQSGDAHNPHAHLVVRDRDHESGRRVVGMSEKGSTERVRLLWEQAANDALAEAGSAARVDRRSLLEQGVKREPSRHKGPAVHAIQARGERSTVARRTAKGMKPRHKAMEAARRARSAQEARNVRQAARDAEKAEKALRDAQIAAERQEVARVAKIEAPIARSRTRVLRGRGLRNAVTGFLRNVRHGTAMLEPLPQDHLGRATRSLLSRAGELLKAWRAFREGRHDGDFAGAEQDFTEASTDLAAMHMVLAPPKGLTGAQLAHEQDRMASLAAFPDQDLIRPAIGAARGRAAEIERHLRTPEGAARMAEHHTAQKREADRRRADQEARERRRAEEDERYEDEQSHRDGTLFRASIERAHADPRVRAILARWIDLDRPPLDVRLDPRWMHPTDDGRTVWQRVKDDLEDLDRRGEQTPLAPEPAPPQPALRPQPRRDHPTRHPASRPDPEPRPWDPDPGSGLRGPGS